MTETAPTVTIVMPVRNEAAFIERSLTAVLEQQYPSHLVQVLVVDGMSDDGTRERIHQVIAQHPERAIAVLDNPGRIVPTGLNRAIPQAAGEMIIRVDGHCEVPPDYIRRCIAALKKTGADCAGGVIETVGNTLVARAIALAQRSSFGVGGVAFRTGKATGMFVDTVAFGAYRRDVFDRIGLFDEELVRNQDDEFNFRLIQAGGKIWMDPSIRTVYYSRASFRKLWRQYAQYGLYKVRVIQKRGAVPSWRHLVPAAFVLALVLALLATAVTGNGLPGGAVVGSYAVATLGASLWSGRNDVRLLPLLPLAFFVLHFAYGIGFWQGLWHWRKGWGERDAMTGGR